MKSFERELLERTAALMKERRIALGLKQEEAAARAGISIRALQQLEQRGMISLLRLLKLVTVYRMEQNFVQFLNDRSGWTLEELARGESKRVVR